MNSKAKVTSFKTGDVSSIFSKGFTNDVTLSSRIKGIINLTLDQFEKLLQAMGHARSTATTATATPLEDNRLNTVGISFNPTISYDNDYWILAIGATDHMTKIND